MKRKKKRTRLIAILAVVIMAFIQATPVSFAEQNTNSGSSQQITDASKKAQIYENGDLKIDKYIEGTDTENKFQVTLDVTTTEKLDEIPTSADAAVVLVMDTSNSMSDEKIAGSKKSRADAAVDAAKSFIDAFGTVEGSLTEKRLIKLVQFGSNAKVKNGWNWENVLSSSGKKRSKEDINSLDWSNGGTNIEGGLQLAYNVIKAADQDGTLEGIKNVNVIMLTDGCPTYHIADDASRNSTAYIKGARGGGNRASWNDHNSVTKDGGIAQKIKELKVNESPVSLYSIAFATGNASFQQSPRGNYKNQNVFTWLSGFSSKAFKSDDTEELINNFNAILTLIKLGAEAWYATDPMGENILYLGKSSQGGSQTENAFTYNESKRQLTWDLKNSPRTEQKDGRKTYYSYTLTYPIALDTTQKGFEFQKSVETNGLTDLAYFMFSKVNDDQVLSKLNHQQFEVPKIQGFCGDFTFKKVKEDKKTALPGANFQLSGTASGSEKTVIMNAASGEDGTVSFDKIPAGNYKLSETTAPEGYEASSSKYDVKVAYGNVTIEGKPAEEFTAIANTPKKVQLNVHKTIKLEAQANPKDIPDTLCFTFNLYKNGGSAGEPKVEGNALQSLTITAKELKEQGLALEKAFTDKVKSGEYVIIEDTSKVPAGWEYDTKMVAVTVADGKAVYSSGGNNFENKFYGLTDITAQKEWKYNDFQDKKTPTSVQFELWHKIGTQESKVDITGNPATLRPDSNGEWKASTKVTWENLPQYSVAQNGIATKIHYFVKEINIADDDADHYDSNIDDSGLNVTNEYKKPGPTPEISKKIEIAGDEAGTIPKEFSFQFKLYKGTQELGTAVISNDTEKQEGVYGPVKFVGSDNKPVKLAKGDYIIQETAADGWGKADDIRVKVDSYGDITYNNQNSVTATNTWLGLKDVTAEKIWSDGNDQDKVRPDKITLALKKDGTLIEDSKQEITVDGSKNKDVAVWKKLPVYHPDKTKIHYTVVEFNGDKEVTDSYDDEYTTVYSGLTVTNTHVPDKTAVKGTKIWKDGEDLFKTRPDSVEVTLFADGAATNRKTKVTKENNWTYEFKELPVYKDGVKIDYSVKETKIGDQKVETENEKETAAGYIVTYDGTNIINTLDDYEAYSWDGTIKVTKNVIADSRPQKVTDTFYVALFSDKECTIRAQMPDPNPEGQGADMDIPVQKIQLSGSDTGTAEFKGIPVGTADEAITYYLAEVADDSGQLLGEDYEYRASIKVDGTPGNQIELTVKNHQGKAEITNSFNNETSVKGVKNWENDQFVADLFRPDSITVKLLQNGKVYQTKEVKADDKGEWIYTFDKLPKFDKHGTLYQYTVDEVAVDGYSVTAEGMDLTNTLQGYLAGSVSITKKVTLRGSPYNVAGVFYAGIFTDPACKNILTVNQDGREVSAVAALPVDGTQSQAVTVDGLPLGAGGEPVKYYIAETDSKGNAITEGNEFTISIDHPEVTVDARGTKAVTITNEYAQKAELSGTKTWNDDNNAENKRPASIKVTLLQNGKVYKDPITDSALVKTVTAKDNWSYHFVNLADKDETGKPYEYSVMETGAEAAYTSEVSGMNLVNTLNVEQYYYQGTIDITKKTMLRDKAYNVDDVYYAGVFTDSHYTNLLTDENGEDIIYAIALDNESQASIQVPVPAGAKGEAITYYVTEVDEYGTPVDSSGSQQFTCEVKGGVCSVKGGGTGKVTFTNTYQVKKVPQTGDSDSSMLWLLLLLILATLTIGYVLIYRKLVSGRNK